MEHRLERRIAQSIRDHTGEDLRGPRAPDASALIDRVYRENVRAAIMMSPYLFVGLGSFRYLSNARTDFERAHMTWIVRSFVLSMTVILGFYGLYEITDAPGFILLMLGGVIWPMARLIRGQAAARRSEMPPLSVPTIYVTGDVYF